MSKNSQGDSQGDSIKSLLEELPQEDVVLAINEDERSISDTKILQNKMDEIVRKLQESALKSANDQKEELLAERMREKNQLADKQDQETAAVKAAVHRLRSLENENSTALAEAVSERNEATAVRERQEAVVNKVLAEGVSASTVLVNEVIARKGATETAENVLLSLKIVGSVVSQLEEYKALDGVVKAAGRQARSGPEDLSAAADLTRAREVAEVVILNTVAAVELTRVREDAKNGVEPERPTPAAGLFEGDDVAEIREMLAPVAELGVKKVITELASELIESLNEAKLQEEIANTVVGILQEEVDLDKEMHTKANFEKLMQKKLVNNDSYESEKLSLLPSDELAEQLREYMAKAADARSQAAEARFQAAVNSENRGASGEVESAQGGGEPKVKALVDAIENLRENIAEAGNVESEQGGKEGGKVKALVKAIEKSTAYIEDADTPGRHELALQNEAQKNKKNVTGR
jgi:hypothetical protein